MRSIITQIAVAAALLTAPASAQSGGFGPARLAVIFQPASGTLHPVNGVSLANRTGGAIAGVPKLMQAVVAHHGGFALGVSESGTLLLVRMPVSGTTTLTELAGLDAPDAIALSPRSLAAVVIHSGKITVLTNLESEPAQRTLSATAPNLTVSDSGAAIALYSPERGMVEIWNSQTGATFEIPLKPTAISFVTGSDDLLLADASRYYVVRGGVPVTLPSAEAQDQPLAVASSADGRFYFLAGTTGRVLRIDARDFSSAAFDCGCNLTRLQPGNGYARFQIADAAGGRLVFLDWGDPPSLFSVQLPVAEVRQ